MSEDWTILFYRVALKAGDERQYLRDAGPLVSDPKQAGRFDNRANAAYQAQKESIERFNEFGRFKVIEVVGMGRDHA